MFYYNLQISWLCRRCIDCLVLWSIGAPEHIGTWGHVPTIFLDKALLVSYFLKIVPTNFKRELLLSQVSSNTFRCHWLLYMQGCWKVWKIGSATIVLCFTCQKLAYAIKGFPMINWQKLLVLQHNKNHQFRHPWYGLYFR